MGYSAGDAILDDEYNTFVASTSDPFGYNHFAGAGGGGGGGRISECNCTRHCGGGFKHIWVNVERYGHYREISNVRQ